jgi:Domain of unknown function (DUF4838)/Glycosyl hydrolase family 67 N-terminus
MTYIGRVPKWRKGHAGMSGISRRKLLQDAALSVAGLSLRRAAALTPLTLVHDGRSKYSIVLAPDASPSEQRGANELQHFIEQISGARLPVTTDPAGAGDHAILVGQSAALDALQLGIDFEALGPEGYVLRTAGEHLVIAGGRQRGAMYGVYGFLEKLGCRWFSPTVSRIPKMRSVRVEPLNETVKPAFEYREVYFNLAFDRDWSARNRMNGMSANLDASTGGKVIYHPFVHTFALLIPPDKYFKDHPEYFSLVDGARRDHAQLCLTNPDVLRISIETVRGWMRDYPEATIFSVSQNDTTGWCECDNCRRVEEEEGGAHSGPLLRFVNAVAEAVEPDHPDKLIDTLAYWYTEDPPVEVRPRRNVRIRLCPIGACEAHPYDQCPYDAYFLGHLQAWSQITSQLYIWHYNTNFANYLLPFPDFDQLASSIPMYAHHGVVGMFMEGCRYPGVGSDEALRSYVMAKLLWDTKADVRQAIDEFHTAYYGPAARPMRAYFDLMQRQARPAPRGKGHHAWIFDRADAPYLNEEFITQATQLFDQATRAAAGSAAQENVRRAKLSIDYLHLARERFFTVQGAWYQPANLAGLKARWTRFVADLQALGITAIRERVDLPEDEQAFATLMRPYPVITLENESLRVHLVPELGARVVHIVDKRSGRDLLLRPNSAALHYPAVDGLTLIAQSDYVGATPWNVTWKVVSVAHAEVRLTGVCENGMTLDYALRLNQSMLETAATVRNTSNTAAMALLQSHCNADAVEIAQTSIHFQSLSSASVAKQLIQPGLEPSGSQTWSDAEQPDGEWRLVNQSSGTILVNRFSPDQAARCQLNWTAKSENRAVLSVLSMRKMLQPGGRLQLDSHYGIV